MEQLIQTARFLREQYASTLPVHASFNIFDVTGIAAKEVRICRLLRELLDPRGTHGQKDRFLRAFVDIVLQLPPFSDKEYDSAIVQREYLIQNDRRIDLFIQIGICKIPIEVKIYAEDQHEQCFDYYHYAQNSKIYYLTLDGHLPSTDSAGALDPEQIHPISFRSHVIAWIDACLALCAGIPSVYEILSQFSDCLYRLTRKIEEDLSMEMQQHLLSSPEALRDADLIANAAKQAEYQLKLQVFRELDTYISSKYSLKRLDQSKRDHFCFPDKANSGISYKLCRLEQSDLELWLRVEMGNEGIYAGVCIAQNDDYSAACADAVKHLREEITNGVFPSTSWWVAWAYLNDLHEQCPNFKIHNDAYYRLCDPNGFQSFLAAAYPVIDSIYACVKKKYLPM